MAKRGRPAITEAREREKDMYAMYLADHTLQSIGDKYKMTRERVRQLLQKFFGCTKSHSGLKAKVAERNAAKRAELDKYTAKRTKKTIQATFGCSREKFIAIAGIPWHKNKGRLTAAHRYYHQMRAAVRDGVEWKFTFPDWWEIWQKSGKWQERGRRRYGYCLTRKDKTKPFEVGNVHICTLKESSTETRRQQFARKGRAREEQNG